MGHGFPYFAVATRILFDMDKAYPRFIFSAIRALSDEEADDVIAMRDDPRTKRITDEAVEFLDSTGEPAAEQAPPVATSLFEQGFQQTVTQQVAPVQEQKPVQAPQEAAGTPAPARRKKAAQTPSQPQQTPVQQAEVPHDPVTGEVVDDEEAALLRQMEQLRARKAAQAAAAAKPAPAAPKPAPAPAPAQQVEDAEYEEGDEDEDEDFESMLDKLVSK